jgi:methoxymalonate biosynthesis acyl carrier protein
MGTSMHETDDVDALGQRLVALFATDLKIVVPSFDTDLFDSALLDSLAFVELLLHLERQFGVATSMDDLETDNFRTISRIADFVQARTAARPVAVRVEPIVAIGSAG